MTKQFSDREKKLISSICYGSQFNTYVLTSAFEEWLFNKKGICFDLEKGQLVYDLDIYQEVDDILNIKKEIIKVALLLKYLEDNNYIYIIQDKTSSEDPRYVGTKKIKTPIQIPLPNEIAFIIRRSLYNVIASYDLIQLVSNGFKTYEDLQLEAASKQLEASRNQLASSIQQALSAQALIAEAKNQTAEIQKQTKSILRQVKLANKQLDEAKNQSEEAKRQTVTSQKQVDLAQKQLDEAQKQTGKAQEQVNKAQEQTDESKKQTEEARGQRKAAWWAVGTSGLAIIVAIIMPLIISKCNREKEKNEAVERTMGTIDSVIVPTTRHLNNSVDTIKFNTDILKQQYDCVVKISNKQASKKKSNTNKEK